MTTTPIRDRGDCATPARSGDRDVERGLDRLWRHPDRVRAELAAVPDRRDTIERTVAVHQTHGHMVVAEDRAG